MISQLLSASFNVDIVWQMFLQLFRCSLQLADNRRVINVNFTTSMMHLAQHPDQVVQDFLLSLRRF